MVVRTYPVLVRCLEDGINYGWERAFKYTDAPSEEAIKDAILQGAINEICEWFTFLDGEDD
jgi:hypothetical protein